MIITHNKKPRSAPRPPVQQDDDDVDNNNTTPHQRIKIQASVIFNHDLPPSLSDQFNNKNSTFVTYIFQMPNGFQNDGFSPLGTFFYAPEDDAITRNLFASGHGGIVQVEGCWKDFRELNYANLSHQLVQRYTPSEPTSVFQALQTMAHHVGFCMIHNVSKTILEANDWDSSSSTTLVDELKDEWDFSFGQGFDDKSSNSKYLPFGFGAKMHDDRDGDGHNDGIDSITITKPVRAHTASVFVGIVDRVFTNADFCLIRRVNNVISTGTSGSKKPIALDLGDGSEVIQHRDSTQFMAPQPNWFCLFFAFSFPPLQDLQHIVIPIADLSLQYLPSDDNGVLVKDLVAPSAYAMSQDISDLRPSHHTALLQICNSFHRSQNKVYSIPLPHKDDLNPCHYTGRWLSLCKQAYSHEQNKLSSTTSAKLTKTPAVAPIRGASAPKAPTPSVVHNTKQYQEQKKKQMQQQKQQGKQQQAPNNNNTTASSVSTTTTTVPTKTHKPNSAFASVLEAKLAAKDAEIARLKQLFIEKELKAQLAAKDAEIAQLQQALGQGYSNNNNTNHNNNTNTTYKKNYATKTNFTNASNNRNNNNNSNNSHNNTANTTTTTTTSTTQAYNTSNIKTKTNSFWKFNKPKK